MALLSLGANELMRQAQLFRQLRQQESALGDAAKSQALPLVPGRNAAVKMAGERTQSAATKAAEAMRAFIVKALEATDGDDDDPNAFGVAIDCLPSANGQFEQFAPFAEFVFNPWLQRLLFESKIYSREYDTPRVQKAVQRLREARVLVPTMAQLSSFAAMDPRFFHKQGRLLNVMATGTGKTFSMFGCYYRAVMSSYTDYRHRLLWAARVAHGLAAGTAPDPEKILDPKRFLPCRVLPHAVWATVKLGTGGIGRVTLPVPRRPEPMLAVHVAPAKVIDQTINELREMARNWGLEFDVLTPEPVEWSMWYSHFSGDQLRSRYQSDRPTKENAMLHGDFWFTGQSLLPRARISVSDATSALVGLMDSPDDLMNYFLTMVKTPKVRYAVMHFPIDAMPAEAKAILGDLPLATGDGTVNGAFAQSRGLGRMRAEVRLVFMDMDAAAGPVGPPITYAEFNNLSRNVGSLFPLDIALLPNVTHLVIDEAHMLVAHSKETAPKAVVLRRSRAPGGIDLDAKHIAVFLGKLLPDSPVPFFTTEKATITGLAWQRSWAAQALTTIVAFVASCKLSVDLRPDWNKQDLTDTPMAWQKRQLATWYAVARTAIGQLNKDETDTVAARAKKPERSSALPRANGVWPKLGSQTFAAFLSASHAYSHKAAHDFTSAITSKAQLASELKLAKGPQGAQLSTPFTEQHVAWWVYADMELLLSRSSKGPRRTFDAEAYAQGAGLDAVLQVPGMNAALEQVGKLELPHVAGDGAGLTLFENDNPEATKNKAFPVFFKVGVHFDAMWGAANTARPADTTFYQATAPRTGLMLMTGTPAPSVEGALVLRALVSDYVAVGPTSLGHVLYYTGRYSFLRACVIQPVGDEYYVGTKSIETGDAIRALVPTFPMQLEPEPKAHTALEASLDGTGLDTAAVASVLHEYVDAQARLRKYLTRLVADTKTSGVFKQEDLRATMKAYDTAIIGSAAVGTPVLTLTSYIKPGIGDFTKEVAETLRRYPLTNISGTGGVVFYEGEGRLMPWLSCPLVGHYKVWQFAGKAANDPANDLPSAYPTTPQQSVNEAARAGFTVTAENFYPAGPQIDDAATSFAVGKNVSDRGRFSVFDMTAAHPDQVVPTDADGNVCDITRFDAVFLTIHRIIRSRAAMFGPAGAIYGKNTNTEWDAVGAPANALKKEQWDRVVTAVNKPLPSEMPQPVNEQDGAAATFKTLVLYLGPPDLWPVFCDFGQEDYIVWANPDSLAAQPVELGQRVEKLRTNPGTELAQLEQDVVSNTWSTEPLALAPAPKATDPTTTITQFLSGRYGVDVLLLNGHEATGVDTKGIDLVILVGGADDSSAELNMQSVGRLLRAGSAKTEEPVFAVVICGPHTEYKVPSSAAAQAVEDMRRASITRCMLDPTQNGCAPTNGPGCFENVRKAIIASSDRFVGKAAAVSGVRDAALHAVGDATQFAAEDTKTVTTELQAAEAAARNAVLDTVLA